MKRIIDAHLHLPWEDAYNTIELKYNRLKKELKANNIEYGILIADSHLETNIGNNSDILELVKRDSKLFMIYGYSPLERQEEQIEEIKAYAKKKYIKGIKLYPGHENFSMNDLSLDKIFKLAIEYNIPIVIHTEWNNDNWPQYSHPLFIKEIAEKYKDIKIVCSHMWTANALFAYSIIKNYKNIYIDISAFRMGVAYEGKYNFPKLEEAIDILNILTEEIPDRIIFGSDYGSLSILDHIELIEKSKIDKNTKNKLYFENANRLYELHL